MAHEAHKGWIVVMLVWVGAAVAEHAHLWVAGAAFVLTVVQIVVTVRRELRESKRDGKRTTPPFPPLPSSPGDL